MNRRRFLATLAAAGATWRSRGARAGEATLRKTNIVLILADDLGYGDVRCLNPRSQIPTPHMDRVAREGMIFADGHAAAAVCTPTRYAVVTGRYPWRSRLKSGVLNGYSPHLIEPKRLTVGSLLKGAGYHTACVGKWHLGMDWAFTDAKRKTIDYAKPVAHGPQAKGFDYFFGIPASLDFPPYVYVENDRAVEPATATQRRVSFPAFVRSGPRSPGFHHVEALDVLTGKATGYIAQRAKTGQPFLLYFALTAPHKPVLPAPRFRGATKLGPYGDFVVQTDWAVGQVLKALDDAGVAGDTLLIVTSDNGSFMFRQTDAAKPDHVANASVQAYKPSSHRSNHVYRGTKADIWEGGHRVPFLVRWPARVKPGSRCDAPVCVVDFMATCADVAGSILPRDAAEDSFSIVPHLLGRAPATPRAPVIHQSANGSLALREGRWKLVMTDGSGGRERPRGKRFGKPYRLFDIVADPTESRDLAAEHPDLVARLTQQAEALIQAGRSRS